MKNKQKKKKKKKKKWKLTMIEPYTRNNKSPEWLILTSFILLRLMS